MISVIILTLNEAADLPGCLASVTWSDDVHVFDSFSADTTVAVAEGLGARVTRRRFDGYASHRNAALALPDLRHPWVLFLDADERVPQELAVECARAVRDAASDVGAFRMRRRDFFMGRWLKHAQLSPYFVRLQRRGRTRYEREVNEVVKVDGRIVDLTQPFDHFPFSKGIGCWVERHNRYSTMEARCVVQSRAATSFSLKAALFAPDFNGRRVHQKALFYNLPFRPALKLIYMLFVRGAILDGRPGCVYSLLQAMYEWLIVLKTEEIARVPAVVGKPSDLRAPIPAAPSLAQGEERMAK
ncbi:MAG: glycosyltransferase family 2 protein [Verrucomicrobia bacterium]|nr:glycosyltransferase family 2 protein [Verrucomicrobiota bacterium]MBI3870637.1 glycosyltransferase family 2 protein [Verrucomicrobiota bacterium]